MPAPFRRPPAWTETLARAPGPVRGAAWMLLSAAAFAVMNALVRVLGDAGMDPFQIAFFRNLFGLAFMTPWLARTGLGALGTRHLVFYTARGLFGLTAMLLWFWAITLMPLGDAVALSFTAPLFAALAAVLVLGERMGARRTAALLAGFAGMLVMLRPGLAEITFPAVLVVASSVFIACSLTTVKILSRTESPAAIVTWMGLYMTPLSLISALFVWRWPGPEEWLLLLAMGGFGTLGQVAMTRAYAAADATVVLPFDYTKLPFAAAIGYLAFAELPDAWTWAGAAIIAAASVYIAHREARIARRAPRAGAGLVAHGAGGPAMEPPPPDSRAPEPRP